MKKLLSAVSALLLSSCLTNAVAAGSPTSPILELHFIGMENLSANTNASKLTQIWNFPETIDLREKTLQKLASAPSGLFPFSPGLKPALIQPLLADLLDTECVFQLVESTNHQVHLNIAAVLGNTRSLVWSSNLSTISGAAAGNSNHWSAMFSTNVSLSFSREGKWTHVGIGSEQESKKFMDRLKKNELDLQKDSWGEAVIDWVLLEEKFGISIPFKASQSKAILKGKNNELFTTITSEFPGGCDVKHQEWNVPSLIREPVISFTAMQNVARLCKDSKFFQQIEFNPTTSQIFCWSQQDLPFQTFGTILVQDSAKELADLGQKLPAVANPLLANRRSGQLQWNAEQTNIAWTEIPMMIPTLNALSSPDGQFLVGGLFPIAAHKTKPPEALIKKIKNDPKLIYYDWEITQNRIGHWDMITRVLPVFSSETITNSSQRLRLTRTAHSPAHVFLRKIAPLLGNTITEVSASAPKKLLLKRQSHIGFTAMELFYFAGLIDDSEFPLFGHKWPGTSAARK